MFMFLNMEACKEFMVVMKFVISQILILTEKKVTFMWRFYKLLLFNFYEFYRHDVSNHLLY